MAKQKFQSGDIIVIELHGGRELEAEFVRETTDEIIVKKTTDLQSGKMRAHNQTFYCSEIKDIIPISVALPNGKQDHIENQSDINCPAKSNQPNVKHVANKVITLKKKEFTDREIETIQSMAKNTIHIAQFDDTYYNAVNKLIKQEIIFVNYESIFGRLDPKRSILTIATLENVYMFDMLRLGAMKKELKEVFSCELPRKVIHSTAEFADYLKHKENCSLNGAFDTLMVHFNLKKSHNHIKLQKCFEEYFILPDNFVLQQQKFNVRPLSTEAMIRATLTAILLMKLYWHMNDILMQPLQIATTKFAEIYQRVDNQVDLMVCVNDGTHPGADVIELNAVEQLDETFKFLLQ